MFAVQVVTDESDISFLQFLQIAVISPRRFKSGSVFCVEKWGLDADMSGNHVRIREKKER
jgi:hypothetical protein